MKKSVMLIIMLLFLATGLIAQNQFSPKIDSSKTRLLGFNKKSVWSLPAKELIKPQNHNFVIGPEITESKKGFASNMPIHKAQGNFPIVVHVPDSTIDYKMQIIEPNISGKSNN